MGVILRIETDTPYGYQTFMEKIKNYLRLNWWFPAIRKIGYLKSLDNLLIDIEARQIPANFFFTKFTIPKQLVQSAKYSVGAHLVSARNYDEFQKELNLLSKKLKRQITGFTKHGSGKLKLCRTHAVKYESDKYIDWAQKAKLKYFLGNGENPEDKSFYVGNVLVYPSAFWLNENYRISKYNIDWLVEESTGRDVVVLLHPYNWYTNKQVRADYEKMVEKIDKFKLI